MLSARIGSELVRRPAWWASMLFLIFALPTMFLPLVARDFYHLERADQYLLSEFWKADDFQFYEYFWWPFEGFYCRFFRPLWSASVALMYQVFELSPLPYRIWWVALHLVSIALFVAIVRRIDLSPRAKLFAAAVYTLHPFWCSFALEPVAVGSANAMVMVILLGSLWAFMRWRDEGWRPGYALALGGVFVALVTKEIGVIVAPLLVAYDYLIPLKSGARPAFGQIVKRHAPACVLVAIHLLLYVTVISRVNHLRPPYYLTFETEGYALRMLHQIGLYLAQPLVIGIYHPLGNAELYMEQHGLFLGLLAFAFASYFLLLRRTWRLPWAQFAVAFLLLSIIPVLPVIVQFQEFAPGAAAVAILIALAIDRSLDRARGWIEAAVLAYYGGALAIALFVSAALAGELRATSSAVDKVVPDVAPGSQLYFINTPQYAWLGEASRLRLRYREPALEVQHLSFDCGELPPNPRTVLGGALTAVAQALAPQAVTSCEPQLKLTSDRSLVLSLDGKKFFDSDLGRFVLQGRGSFEPGETSRRGQMTARIDRVEDGLPLQMSFAWPEPISAGEQIFLRWKGTEVEVLRFDR